tara:strand:- start:981 stop:1391 length:411 start_codon:yes stop_codon:yes gene_type:complete
MAWFSLHVISAICVASVFAGMIFFTAASAPTIFRTLDPQQASWVMRQAFPRCYNYLAVQQGVGAAVRLPAHSHGFKTGILAISCIVNLLLRQFLLPCIAFVGVPNPATFPRLDRLSMTIKIGLLDAVATVLARRAQ